MSGIQKGAPIEPAGRQPDSYLSARLLFVAGRAPDRPIGPPGGWLARPASWPSVGLAPAANFAADEHVDELEGRLAAWPSGAINLPEQITRPPLNKLPAGALKISARFVSLLQRLIRSQKAPQRAPVRSGALESTRASFLSPGGAPAAPKTPTKRTAT